MDETLQEHGVFDATLRKDICGSFTFSLGNFLDQYRFEADGQRAYPLMCFCREDPVGVVPAEPGDVYLPSDSFLSHEYAFGNVSEHFDGDSPPVKADVS